MRVLVVDDSRTMRTIIRRTLESLRQPETEIIEASDGAEALQILRNERLELDVVLLDWSMPRLDGIGLLKAMKVMAPVKEIPVIMITSQSQQGHVAEALRWGARDYVVKPFTEETLKEKFARLQSQIEVRKCTETSLMLQAIANSATAEAAPFLSQLPPELIVEMKLRGRRRIVGADVTLTYPQQTLDTLDIVLSGEVEVEESDGSVEILEAGSCVGESSFVSGKPLGSTIRSRGGCEILQLSRLALGDLTRRFPKLSYALSSLVARRSTTRRRSGDPSEGFTGRLNVMPISDLVQVLHLCHKTGELRLEQGERHASIFVEDGTILDAAAGRTSGEEAVYEILGWKDAAFTFRSGVKSGRRTVSQPTMSLLMEGARRLDEGRRN